MKYFFSLLLAAGMLGACNQKKQQCSYLILLDISASRDSQFIAWSRAVIESAILPRLEAKDRLEINAIDGGSVTAHQALFSIDCGMFDYGNEFAGLQAQELIKKHIADTVMHAWLRNEVAFDSIVVARQKFRNQTDILGALDEIGNRLDDSYTTHIFLFSDMLHDADSIQFANINSQVQAESLQASIQAPSLDGVKVTVLTGIDQHISKQQFVLLREFWTTFFRRSGATLVSYGNAGVVVAHNNK
jgi:hypothetical protein